MLLLKFLTHCPLIQDERDFTGFDFNPIFLTENLLSLDRYPIVYHTTRT